MNTILSGVAIRVISGIIMAILGIGGIKKVIHIHKKQGSNTLWKLLVIFGYILFCASALYSFSWFIAEGFNDKAVIWFGYCMIGFTMIVVGRAVLFLKR